MVGRNGRAPRARIATFALVGVVAMFVAAVAVVGLPARAPSDNGRAAAGPRSVAFTRAARVLDSVLAHSPIPAPTTTVAPPRPMVRAGVGLRPLRILVVGDSVGNTFARGVEQWAAQHGHAQVLDDARPWCALGRALPISQGIVAHVPGSGCTWTTRWAAAVHDFDPDVTLVLFSIWEVSPRQLPGGAWKQPGDPALDAWQRSEYRAAADTLSARGAPVVWLTIPCEQTPTLPGTPFWVVNHRTIPAVAASRPAVHVIDLDHAICAQGPMSSFGGVAVPRPDGAHFSDPGALAAANWVMPIVLGAAPNPPLSRS